MITINTTNKGQMSCVCIQMYYYPEDMFVM